jgi:hypothetical protein
MKLERNDNAGSIKEIVYKIVFGLILEAIRHLTKLRLSFL